MPLTTEQRDRLLRDLIATGNEMASKLRGGPAYCSTCDARSTYAHYSPESDTWERLLDDARAEGLLPP